MATIPEPLNITIIQGQSFLQVFQRVDNVARITLVGGPDAGTWQILAYGVLTAALPINASAAAVQLALQLNPTIGGNGITVTRSGSGTSGAPYVYDLAWAGHFLVVPQGMKVLLQPLPTVVSALTVAGAAVAPTVAYRPFDFTSWTMRWTLAPRNADGTFGTVIIEITEATTVANPGRVYIGYVPPAVEGGTPGTVDPTNGTVALSLSAAATAALTATAFLNGSGQAAGYNRLLGVNGTWKKVFYEGTAAFVREIA